MRKLFYLIIFILSTGFASEFESLVGNAGCLIKKHNKILFVTQNSGKLSIPGGTANSNETAPQTAIRETYEETQQIVWVETLIKKFKNDFYLFECRIQKNQKSQKELKPLKSYEREIKKVGFYDIRRLKPDDLRFPSQYNLYFNYQENN